MTSSVLPLWTFIVDYDGGTFIFQFRNETVEGAIGMYNTADPSGMGIVPLDDFDVATIDGVKNTFCSSSSIGPDKILCIATVVLTENAYVHECAPMLTVDEFLARSDIVENS